MQVGIVAQRENPRAASLAGDLRGALRDRDVTVWVDEATAEALALPEASRPMSAFDEADLVVAVGGDGTFLFAGRHAGGTPILGVNLGEVGFLNAVPPDDAREVVLREVDAFRGGGLDAREVPRIAARVEREEWTSDPAANEIVVQGARRGHGGGTDYEVRVDGSLYSGGHADGVLIATPTGSSAYNLSEGGPLVHPGVDALVVNEMCAAQGMPPLAVDTDSTVTVTLTGEGTTGVVISDGRHPKEVDAPVSVTVERTDPPMRIAGPSADYFEALGKLS